MINLDYVKEGLEDLAKRRKEKKEDMIIIEIKASGFLNMVYDKKKQRELRQYYEKLIKEKK